MKKIKIPENLKQFKEEKALILSVSRYRASFYLAFKGELGEVNSIFNQKEKFSDKEGYSERKGLGRFFGAGFVLEPNKREERKKFMKEIEGELEKMLKKEKDISGIYIFSSQFMSGFYRKELSKRMRGIVKGSFRGNYAKLSPLKLIEKIDSKDKKISKKAIQPIKEEAKKILDKFKKANKR